LAVACDAGVYKTRVYIVNGFEVHFVFLEAVRDVILDEDVAALGEFVEDLDALGICEGKANRFLVAINLKLKLAMTCRYGSRHV